MQDRKAALMRAAKRQSTRVTYDQAAGNLEKTWFPEEGRWLRPTYDDLLTWLVIMRGKDGKALASQSTVRNTVNALREEFVINAALGRGPGLTYSQDQGLALAMTGFMRGGVQPHVEYGPITFDKLEKVLEYVGKQRQPNWALWWRMLFEYGFALRVEESALLRRCDFGLGDNGRWYVRIPLSKPRTPEQDRQLETHWCSPRAQALVAQRLGQAVPTDTMPMFASVTAEQINAVIAAVAKAEGWSTQLRWSSHGFRVGSLNDALKETGDLAEVERRGAHRSEAMKIKYSADEAARLQTTLPGGPQAAAAVRVDRRKRAKAVTHPRGVRVQVQLARRA